MLSPSASRTPSSSRTPSGSRALSSSHETSGSRSPTRKLASSSGPTGGTPTVSPTSTSASSSQATTASPSHHRTPRSPKLSTATRSSTSTRLPLLDSTTASPKIRASTSERVRHPHQPSIKDVRTRRAMDLPQSMDNDVTAASPGHRRRRANPLGSDQQGHHASTPTSGHQSSGATLSPIRAHRSPDNRFGLSSPSASDRNNDSRRIPLLMPLTRAPDRRQDASRNDRGHHTNSQDFSRIDSLGSPIEHHYSLDMTTTTSLASSSTATTLSPYHGGHRFSITSAVSSIPGGLCLTDRSDVSSNAAGLSIAEPPPQPYIRNRRTAVSSEPVTIQSIKDWHPPVHPKSEEEEGRISQVISTKLNVLFGHLSKENEGRVVSAMFKRQVPNGTVLIKQGDEGDNFYIVDEGKFDIFVTRADGATNKVLEAVPGMSFGELALMYNAARAATCIATEDSIVWALDRLSFRMLLVTAENTKKKRYETLLERIEIFKCLTKYERSQLSDILVVQECKEGEPVIRQGDRGDKFYIVESGELVCKIKQDDGPEIEVHRYRRGGYFGELALIMKYGIRKASVYSVGSDTRLLWIGKSTFDRVLGPIIDILRKNASLYPTYAQLLNRRQ